MFGVESILWYGKATMARPQGILMVHSNNSGTLVNLHLFALKKIKDLFPLFKQQSLRPVIPIYFSVYCIDNYLQGSRRPDDPEENLNGPFSMRIKHKIKCVPPHADYTIPK